ncbi:MAG: hypothetical protein M3N18_07965 [Actinomycetota bacterium]|nr:hypothetical protein [Actinomycetota bacterium]
MRRLLLLAGFALVASLIFATAVAAQDAPEDTPPEEQQEAQGAQGEEDPGILAPPVGETEEFFGEQEVIETPLEEAVEEPVEEAIGADQPEPKAEEAIEEKAQEKVGVKGEVKVEETKVTVEETIPAGYAPLPKSGGPAAGSVLLPAAALLLGAGLLTYAVLRRR